MRRRQAGFTLMELMVVIVIVAILAAVAVPLYINYVKDAQRTEAKGAIGAIITGEQTYYQRYGTYTEDISLINVDLTDVSGNWQTPALSAADSSFTVTMTGRSDKTTKGLQVSCTYTRGSEPSWTEQ